MSTPQPESRVRAWALAICIASMLIAGVPIPSALESGSKAQAPARGIAGRVIDALTDRALEGVVVTVADPSNRSRTSVNTNNSGTFVVREPPIGPLMLTASHPGYMQGVYGERFPGDQAVPAYLGVWDERSDVRVRLWRLASLAGHIETDEQTPLAGVTVRAFVRNVFSGRERFLGGPSAVTDGDGMYQLPDLVPQTYLIAAVPGSRGREANTPSGAVAVDPPSTFFPGTVSTVDAGRITLRPGDARVGVDVVVKRSACTRLSGVVTGKPADSKLDVELIDGTSGAAWTDLPAQRAPADASGQFEFPCVLPGQYRLRAATFPPVERQPGALYSLGDGPSLLGRRGEGPLLPVSQMPTYWIDQPVLVDGTQRAVRVTAVVNRGARIRGRVLASTVGGQLSATQLFQSFVTVSPANGQRLRGVQVAPVDSAGRFETVGLPAGRYALMFIGQPSTISVRQAGIESNGIDLSHDDVGDVVVTASMKHTTLSGPVQAPQSVDARACSVYVFPEDRRLWTDFGTWTARLREVRPTREGTFILYGIPPGRYLVAGRASGMSSLWREPAFLEALASRAVKVEVVEGGYATSEVVVIR